MIYVGPTAGERFYLRTLLMIVRGPTSFEDLKSVDGESCESFHDACLRRGLLEDDREWDICLQEAAEIKTGSQLRHLFATLLLFCTPAQPRILWLKFRDKICDDLRHKLYELGRISIFLKMTFTTLDCISLTTFFATRAMLYRIFHRCHNPF